MHNICIVGIGVRGFYAGGDFRTCSHSSADTFGPKPEATLHERGYTPHPIESMSNDPMTAPVGPAQETSKTPESAGENAGSSFARPYIHAHASIIEGPTSRSDALRSRDSGLVDVAFACISALFWGEWEAPVVVN